MEAWQDEYTGHPRSHRGGAHGAFAERGERDMPPQEARLRTLEDIERLERVPLARRLAVGSTYEVLNKAVAKSSEQPAQRFLPLGASPQSGEGRFRTVH